MQKRNGVHRLETEHMKNLFYIKDISTYRSELMGWSILWIMMLHFTFTQITPLGFVAQYGFAGVDIFMLMSGLGLFYSLEKDSNPLRFYKKRLFRIFPTYYIIGFFVNLITTHDDLLTFLFKYSTIGYWTGGAYADWFIPSIIALYLIAPLLKTVIDKRWFVLIALCVVAILATAYFFADKEDVLDRAHFFLLYRIPAFIFGMVCAYWLKNGKPTRYFYFVLLTGIPFFVFFFPLHHHIYNFKYYSLAFLLPLFILCFTLLSKGVHAGCQHGHHRPEGQTRKTTIVECFSRSISYLLNAMGQASLEIYLIQGIFFSFVIEGKTSAFPQWHDTLTLLMIIVSTALGITAHWLYGRLCRSPFSHTRSGSDESGRQGEC